MRIPHRKILAGVLCAAALTLPAWAEEIDAAGEHTPQTMEAATVAETALPDAASLPDNDALFYGYLLRRAGVSDEAELMSSAASRLSAKDKALYDHLKAFVTNIADGTETETVYEFTYQGFPTTWTAAELGVDNCRSQEAKDALLDKVNGYYDTGAVFNALLSDCPYELYWYDKSIGNGAELGFSTGRYSAEDSQLTLLEQPSVTITMTVSMDYGRRISDTQYSVTEVDRSLHAGIDDVITNAKAIAEKHKSEGDYDKLLSYTKEICDLVEYDADAAGNDDMPYGDPWQLISVFDNNSATNVVCEGYAKAFKYLCDLSEFNSSKVECFIASGTLSDETEAGPHMWNLVTMENGKNYLVDVTNSDSDEDPNPELLFLKGGTPSAAGEYVFYDNFVFAYDNETLRLWGQEFLTLDTADYQNASPAPVSAAAQIRGCSLTLVDDIALNFYLTFDDEALSDSGAYVKLSGSQAADTQTILVSQAFRGTVSGISGTVYRFTAHMPAKRMNDAITLTCYDGQNQPYGLKTPDGETVTEFSYRVRDYLDRAASETSLESLAEAISAYGYYAQRQFGYDTGNAVAPSSSAASKLAAVTAETLASYAPVDSGAVTGLTVTGDNLGDNLTLESSVTQRWIFSVDGALSDYSFRLDGQTVTPKAYDSGSYCVEISGIAAKDLDKTHTLTVSKGGETFTHQCGALSYAYKALTGSGAGTDLQNLVKALYLYHAEAKAYFSA